MVCGGWGAFSRSLPPPLRLRLCQKGFRGNNCHDAINCMCSALLIFFSTYLKHPAGSAVFVSTLLEHLLLCGNKGFCNVIARLQIEVSLYEG
jgi:hypothetical protein